jgi:hypothetical protein
MKFLLPFFIILPMICHGQWIFSPTFSGGQNLRRLNSTSAICYATSPPYKELNTQDTGLTWSWVSWVTSIITMENELVGYSVDEIPWPPYEKVITKTIDGGRTWGEDFPIFGGVGALASNGTGTLFIGQANGILAKTSDRGITFEYQNFYGNILSIAFQDSIHGFVLTSSDSVYQTTDGGNHWTPHFLSEAPRRYFHVTGPNEFWFVAGSNRLLHSVDGGLMVSEVDYFPNDTFSIAGMSFLDSLNGIIVGTKAPDVDKLFYTRDGGEQWKELDLPFQRKPIGCVLMSYNIALISIGGGVFQLDFSKLDAPVPPLKELVLYPNPNSGSFEIEFETNIQKLELNLYSSDGKNVWSGKYEYVNRVYIQQVFSPGVYYLEMKKDWEIEIQKVVIGNN